MRHRATRGRRRFFYMRSAFNGSPCGARDSMQHAQLCEANVIVGEITLRMYQAVTIVKSRMPDLKHDDDNQLSTVSLSRRTLSIARDRLQLFPSLHHRGQLAVDRIEPGFRLDDRRSIAQKVWISDGSVDPLTLLLAHVDLIR